MRMFLMLGWLVLFAAPPAQAGSIQDSLAAAIQKTSPAQKPSVKPKVQDKSVRKPESSPRRDSLSNVQVMKNIPYGDAPGQTLDVYAPYGPGNAPIILFAHGGGWTGGDKAEDSVVANKMRHWTSKGVIFVSINYRLVPAADVPAQAEDIARALYYVQGQARYWGGDAENIAIGGHSAGAHLVMLMSVDSAINKGLKWKGIFALDSAAYDVNAIMRGKHPALYDPVFGTDRDYWRRTSPYLQMKGPAVPMLLVCSSQRRDACDDAERFKRQADFKGGTISILPVDKDHAQVNADLGLAGPYTDAVDAFLKQIGVLP